MEKRMVSYPYPYPNQNIVGKSNNEVSAFVNNC